MRKEHLMNHLVHWSDDVAYDPTTNTVMFFADPQKGNEAMSMIDYYKELYPEKSWLDVASMAIPELQKVKDKDHLKFYATDETSS